MGFSESGNYESTPTKTSSNDFLLPKKIDAPSSTNNAKELKPYILKPTTTIKIGPDWTKTTTTTYESKHFEKPSTLADRSERFKNLWYYENYKDSFRSAMKMVWNKRFPNSEQSHDIDILYTSLFPDDLSKWELVWKFRDMWPDKDPIPFTPFDTIKNKLTHIHGVCYAASSANPFSSRKKPNFDYLTDILVYKWPDVATTKPINWPTTSPILSNTSPVIPVVLSNIPSTKVNTVPSWPQSGNKDFLTIYDDRTKTTKPSSVTESRNNLWWERVVIADRPSLEQSLDNYKQKYTNENKNFDKIWYQLEDNVIMKPHDMLKEISKYIGSDENNLTLFVKDGIDYNKVPQWIRNLIEDPDHSIASTVLRKLHHNMISPLFYTKGAKRSDDEIPGPKGIFRILHNLNTAFRNTADNTFFTKSITYPKSELVPPVIESIPPQQQKTEQPKPLKSTIETAEQPPIKARREHESARTTLCKLKDKITDLQIQSLKSQLEAGKRPKFTIAAGVDHRPVNSRSRDIVEQNRHDTKQIMKDKKILSDSQIGSLESRCTMHPGIVGKSDGMVYNKFLLMSRSTAIVEDLYDSVIAPYVATLPSAQQSQARSELVSNIIIGDLTVGDKTSKNLQADRYTNFAVT
jgi:hypothetical protein